MRALPGVPIAVNVHPAPALDTCAITMAVCVPDPLRFEPDQFPVPVGRIDDARRRVLNL